MRYYLLICLWAAATLMLRGQSSELTIEGNFYEDMNHVLENLNFSEANSGFLLDRSIPLINLDKFDGQTINAGNLSDVDIFGKAYGTLMGACFNPLVQMPSPSGYMDAAADFDPDDNVIPMAILAWRYHQFDPLAVTDNLLSIQNNQLFDVNGRPRSPYIEKTAFVPSLLGNETKLSSLQISFPTDMSFTNLAGTITSFSIDAGNGLQTANPGQSVTVDFATSGDYDITVTANFSTGLVLQGHTKLKVSLANGNKYGDVPDFSFTIPATSQHAGIIINIFYSNRSCVDPLPCPDPLIPCRLIRPLILIDGFDPDNDRTFTNFRERIEVKPFDQGTGGPSLASFMDEAGYDAIFLDYLDGGDDILRNSRAVEDAIKKINEWKNGNGSYEKNIVIGASMGGLTGKGAIMYMETEGYDYQTSQFYSLDGPMYGANLPLGTQFMAHHFLNMKVPVITDPPGWPPLEISYKKVKELVPGIAGDDGTLGRPATRQQLIYKVDQDNPNIIVDPMHTSFMQTFHSMGLSGDGKIHKCEYIVLCNGSLKGIGQQDFDNNTISPQHGLFSFHANVLEELNAIPESDKFDHISGFWSGVLAGIAGITGIRANIDIDTYTVPDNPSSFKTVYEGSVYATLFYIPIVISKVKAKVRGTRPLDTAPGGNVSLAGISAWDVPPLDDNLNVWTPTFCFVPTVSALDIYPPADVLTGDFSNVGSTVGAGISAAHDYMGSVMADIPANGYSFNQENTFHALVHKDIARFLIAQAIGKEEINDSDLVSLDNRTYNFGDSQTAYVDSGDDQNNFVLTKTGNTINHNLTVEGTGKIWINRNDRIAFTDDASNPFNANNTAFHVYFGKGGCAAQDPTTVTVKDGGEITVGEWNNPINDIGLLHVGLGATLNIQRNGITNVGDHSVLYCEGGGTTNVTNGGLLHVNWWTGKIIVRKGGVLRIQEGGMLRVSNGAAVEVEAGGKLIIEAKAVIQLWGGGAPDGESRIHIKTGGELVINGEFDFSHNGYFKFDAGYKLTLGTGTFKLKGIGKDVRFMQFNNSGLLITGNQKLDFSNGKIEYLDGVIAAQEGGALIFKNIKCVGIGKAFYLDDPNLISFNSVDIIEGFNPAIEAWNVRSNIPFSVANCHIEVANTFGVEAYDCQSLRFTNTNIIEPHPSDLTTGMQLIGVKQLTLNNCRISDMRHGIESWDSKTIIMTGGEIARCENGIFDEGTIDLGGSPVNVLMFEGATIRDCSNAAIDIIGNAASGSVLMDCAKLINNQNGIIGKDVTLMIDAVENQHCVTDPIAPNVFIRQNNAGPFIFVCYKNKVVNQVNAKGNYWFPHDNGTWNPVPGSAFIRRKGAGGGPDCNENVPFITLLAAQNEPVGCAQSPTPCQEGEPVPPMGACTVPVNLEPLVVHKEFHNGIDAIKNEQFETGEALLAPVSALKGDAGGNFVLSSTCQDFVNMAFAIVETNNAPRPKTRWRASDQDESLEPTVTLAPNPSDDMVQLICSGAFEVSVIDQLGRVCFKEKAENVTRMDTKNWTAGIYTVNINAFDHAKYIQKRLVVQH